ncbi:MAG: EVE domain-containing protein, partial [Nitrospinales bacterium]
ARNNLKAMKKGDLAFFYHSVSEKQVVGVARVSGESYPDPTISDSRWVVVNLKAVKALKNPVSLADIKSHPKLQEIALVKQSRLSVLPLTRSDFETILKMGNTKM